MTHESPAMQNSWRIRIGQVSTSQSLARLMLPKGLPAYARWSGNLQQQGQVESRASSRVSLIDWVIAANGFCLWLEVTRKPQQFAMRSHTP